MTTTIQWLPVDQGDPSAEDTVLISLPGGVDVGFLERGVWRFTSGHRVNEEVLYWAPMPETPTT